MIHDGIPDSNGNTVPPLDSRLPVPRHEQKSKLVQRARLTLAILAGKLAGASGRLLRVSGGTSLPGMIARRIDPNVLKAVIGASKAKKIVITGSNGKTTTARITAAIAAASGRRVSQNRSGSNMLQGVTSVAVNFAD